MGRKHFYGLLTKINKVSYISRSLIRPSTYRDVDADATKRGVQAFVLRMRSDKAVVSSTIPVDEWKIFSILCDGIKFVMNSPLFNKVEN